MALVQTLKNAEFGIVQSPGDGHCLLHSVVSSWKQQFSCLPPIDLECIRALIFIEAISRSARYTPFLENSGSFITGLRKYLICKHYNQDFGDVVPVIISNSLQVRLDIVNEMFHGNTETITIFPSCRSTGILTVHRRGDHYNGLSHITDFSSHDTSEVKRVYTSETLRSHQLAGSKVRRSVRKLLFSLHIWKPAEHVESISDNVFKYTSHSGPASKNLIYPPRLGHCYQVGLAGPVKFALWNARSINNKIASLTDMVIKRHLDVVAISETWLHGDSRDDIITNQIKQSLRGYEIAHIPRKSSKGGGVALLFKDNFKSNLYEHVSLKSMECMDIHLSYGCSSIRIVIVYRSPKSSVSDRKSVV